MVRLGLVWFDDAPNVWKTKSSFFFRKSETAMLRMRNWNDKWTKKRTLTHTHTHTHTHKETRPIVESVDVADGSPRSAGGG